MRLPPKDVVLVSLATEPAEVPPALARLIAEIRREFGAAVTVETVPDRWDPSRLDAMIRPSRHPESAAVFVQDADDIFWVLAGGSELNTEELVAPPEEHYRIVRDWVLRIGRFGVLHVRDRGWRRLFRPHGRLVLPETEQEARLLRTHGRVW